MKKSKLYRFKVHVNVNHSRIFNLLSEDIGHKVKNLIVSDDGSIMLESPSKKTIQLAKMALLAEVKKEGFTEIGY